MPKIKILTGDNIELLKGYPDNYFDSVITDCPYGLGKEPNANKLLQDWIDHGYHEVKGVGFMGKSWDAFVPQPIFWKEIFRVLKPGGYVLAFFGTRTYDWGTLAIRMAGFEIRDMITYHYGSGFPKSLNIKKSANDKCCQCAEMAIEQEPKHAMFSVSKTNLPTTTSHEGTGQDILQCQLPKQDTRAETSRAKIPTEGDEIGKESSVERGDYNIQKEGELRKCEIHSMPGMGKDDGSKGRIHNGTSTYNGNNCKEIINENRGSSSYRSQPNEQPSIEFIALPKQQHPQESGTWEICDRCLKPIIDSGVGTALKPATEPICMARKPVEGTIAENYLKYGTGAINLDDCRIDTDWNTDKNFRANGRTGRVPDTFFTGKDSTKTYHHNTDGRFPSNVIFDQFTSELLDEQSGVLQSGGSRKGEDGKRNYMDNTKSNSLSGARSSTGETFIDPIRGEYKLGKVHNDSGGASRFFYCAKASQDERSLGCESIEAQKTSDGREIEADNAFQREKNERNNFHPTVKPIALMRYLQRLVTPKGGITLDPFAGSGTSGCSASFEDISEIVLMEGEETYIQIIEARTKYWSIEKNRHNYLEGIKDKPVEEIVNQIKLFA